VNYNEPDRLTEYEERADRRADEYLEDCKVLAMYVRQYHEPDPQEYFFDDNLYTQICVCPACTIAKKYQEQIL